MVRALTKARRRGRRGVCHCLAAPTGSDLSPGTGGAAKQCRIAGTAHCLAAPPVLARGRRSLSAAKQWHTALTVAAATLCLLAPSRATAATPGLPPILRDVGFDQHMDAQVPRELQFVDDTGRAVRLGDYFGDKPVILVLAYYRCPMLCTEVLNGLVRGLMDMPYQIGKDFTVLTVSFDPAEGPELAAAKKRTYVERYARPGAEVGWHFLTGKDEAIRPLTDAVGFRYTWDERNSQYAHASGIVLLTPDGRVSRYLFDVRFSPRDLQLGLTEASGGRVGSPIVNAVMLFCFHYDPLAGKYGPAVMNLMRLGGVLTVLGIGVLVWSLRRGERRRARQEAAGRA